MIIGGVGSRETEEDILSWQRALAMRLVQNGHVIATGLAPGADQAWAYGADLVDPSKVLLFLPWRTFEAHAVVRGNIICTVEELPRHARQMAECIARDDPGYAHLSQGGQKLYTRNVLLAAYVHCVIGSINHRKRTGGGTGMTFRVAERMGVRTWDCSLAAVRDELDAWLP